MKYEVKTYGTDLLKVMLKPGERFYAETGSLVMMDDHIALGVSMGDGTDSGRNIFSRFLRLLRRRLAGGDFFLTTLTNKGNVPGEVVITSGNNGSQVLPIKLDGKTNDIFINKGYFLGASQGVGLDASIKFKPFTSMVGSAELFLNRISGIGVAFVKSQGPMFVKHLKKGEKIKIDEHSLIGMTEKVKYGIHIIRKNKTRLFAKEGFVLYQLEGPGTVIIQSYKVNKQHRKKNRKEKGR